MLLNTPLTTATAVLFLCPISTPSMPPPTNKSPFLTAACRAAASLPSKDAWAVVKALAGATERFILQGRIVNPSKYSFWLPTPPALAPSSCCTIDSMSGKGMNCLVSVRSRRRLDLARSVMLSLASALRKCPRIPAKNCCNRTTKARSIDTDKSRGAIDADFRH